MANNDGWEPVPQNSDGWEPVPTTQLQTKPSMLDNLLSKKTEPIGGISNALTAATTNPLMNTPKIALSAFGIPEEDFAPAIGTALGAYLGSKMSRPNVGAGLGATTGELTKQFIKTTVRGEENQMNVPGAILAGGGVAAGGKLLEGAVKSIGLSSKLIPEQARARFFDKAEQAVMLGKKQLTRNWEKSITSLVEANPETRVNLSEPMVQISNAVNGIDQSIIPQVKSALSRNPSLAAMIEKPETAINLTLKEAQDIKNAITSTTKTIIKRGARGQVTPSETQLFELLGSIDDKIVEQFPHMVDVKNVYRAGKQAFDLARPLVERGKAVESNIFSKPSGMFGAGGTPFMGSTHGKLAFRDITSLTKPGSKLYEATLLAHNLNRAADFVSRMGQIAVGGTIAKMGLDPKN